MPWRRHTKRSVPHPFLVANRLVRGSYVSLQSALAYYGLIRDICARDFGVLAPVPGRPGSWNSDLGAFAYRHIQASFLLVTSGSTWAAIRQPTSPPLRKRSWIWFICRRVQINRNTCKSCG